MKTNSRSNIAFLVLFGVLLAAVITAAAVSVRLMVGMTDNITDSAKERLEASASAVARSVTYEELSVFFSKNWVEVKDDTNGLYKQREEIQKRISAMYPGEEGGIEYAYLLYLVEPAELRTLYEGMGYAGDELTAALAAADPNNVGVMRFLLDNYAVPSFGLRSVEDRKANRDPDDPYSDEDLDASAQIADALGNHYIDYMAMIPREALPDSILTRIGDTALPMSDRLAPASTTLRNNSDGWKYYLSAYAPVLDAAGNPTKILAGVDMKDQHIVDARRSTVTMTVMLSVALTVVFVSGLLSSLLFRKKAAQAEAASTAKSSFLSRMSHEMRTPMNAIVGLCRMAKESKEPQKINEYLDNIAVASRHLRQVIDDILDLSKIESGKTKLDLTEVEFFREIDSIDKLIRPQTDLKRIHFVVNVDKEVPSKLVCDATRLRQIVVNLLSNAIKFTPEDGTVTLSVKLLDINDEICKIEWQVKDDGIGMTDEQQSRLFQAFEQGDNSTTRKYGGTGLGLAISKQFVEMMGGQIWVKSEKGVGSTFFFTTVLYRVGAVAAEAASYEDENYTLPDLTDKHFLLVEDAELNRMIAVNLFESYGAYVDTAKNGLEGYQTFCRNPEKYDIIFMDIQMPVMDGYEAAMKIRTSGVRTAASVPIIAMTADVFKEDVEKAIAAGMNDHVGKPLETEKIERAIAKALNKV